MPIVRPAEEVGETEGSGGRMSKSPRNNPTSPLSQFSSRFSAFLLAFLPQLSGKKIVSQLLARLLSSFRMYNFRGTTGCSLLLLVMTRRGVRNFFLLFFKFLNRASQAAVAVSFSVTNNGDFREHELSVGEWAEKSPNLLLWKSGEEKSGQRPLICLAIAETLW